MAEYTTRYHLHVLEKSQKINFEKKHKEVTDNFLHPVEMFNFEIPSEEDAKNIFADIDASKESIESGVHYLMEWLKQQPHLPDVTDKEFLTIFLVGCKNSLEKAKASLNKYFIFKARTPEIYMNRDPCSEEFRKCMKTMYIIPLPKLTPDCYRVVVNGFGTYNPDDGPTATDVLKLYSTLMDVNTKSDLVRGYISIYDVANVGLSLHRLLLSLWTSTLKLMQNSAPVRVHKVYILNLSPAIQFLVDIGAALASEKLSTRIIIWKKDPRDLIEVLPKEILPIEYGGEEQSVDELKDNTLERLIFYRDWIKSIEFDKADLDKLPNYDSKPQDEVALDEMQGSFRQLSFD